MVPGLGMKSLMEVIFSRFRGRRVPGLKPADLWRGLPQAEACCYSRPTSQIARCGTPGVADPRQCDGRPTADGRRRINYRYVGLVCEVDDAVGDGPHHAGYESGGPTAGVGV